MPRTEIWDTAVSAAVPAGFFTVTGNSRCVVVPSPSCPLELSPQHRAVPSAIKAHVCARPLVTMTTDAAAKHGPERLLLNNHGEVVSGPPPAVWPGVGPLAAPHQLHVPSTVAVALVEIPSSSPCRLLRLIAMPVAFASSTKAPVPTHDVAHPTTLWSMVTFV